MRRVPFRKPRDADPESPRVGQAAMRPDETHELVGILKRIARAVVVEHVAGRVAAQGQDVLDRRFGIAVQDRGDLVPAVADAGQVRDGRQLRFALNAHDQVVGSLAGRAARAVGHRHERGLQRLQLRDRREQLLRGLVGLGREELEAEGGGRAL